MKIDIYHLYRHFEYSNFVYPIVLDVLKIWAEEIGIDVTFPPRAAHSRV